MLLQLVKNPTPPEVESVLAVCRELGYSVRTLGERRELLELAGPGRPGDRGRFEDLAVVRRVLDSSDAPELHERTPERPGTCVRPARGGAAFGDGSISLAAGPCAVESPERLLEIARAVRAAGATLLRGGAFKPRSSPHSFQGSREAGLEALRAAREEVGIGVVTEVLDPRDLEAVAGVADVLQVGSRNMQNSALLRELGRLRVPVLLKRGFAATVREFLLAAEFVLAGGNEQVILCERGVRGFDEVTRNVLDVGAVAHLKRATHLPVIVDPSHAAGRRELVRPLARAGLAAGADGLIVEVHPAPTEARSDGAQAVTPDELRDIVADARVLAELDGRRLVLAGPAAPPARTPRPPRPHGEPVA